MSADRLRKAAERVCDEAMDLADTGGFSQSVSTNAIRKLRAALAASDAPAPRMPTMDEVYRFIESNSLTTAEMLREICMKRPQKQGTLNLVGEEIDLLKRGIEDVLAGRTKPLEEVRKVCRAEQPPAAVAEKEKQ